MSSRQRKTEPPLIGRAEELESFSKIWHDPIFRGIVVRGVAGVGKTRLAEEFARRAKSEKFSVLRASTSVSAENVPFGALAHLLPADSDVSDPVDFFTRASEAISDARKYPLILMDDIQFIDATSSVLLHQLLDAGSVKLIATMRIGETVPEPAASIAGRSDIAHMDLGNLSETAVGEMLESSLGGNVALSTRTRLHDLSGGNPLFLRELLLKMSRSNALTNSEGFWRINGEVDFSAAGLPQMINDKVRGVDGAAHSVVELLSAVGPTAVRDALEMAPLDQLAELEAAGIIQVRSEHRREYLELAHPLYAESVRADMSPSRHRDLVRDQTARVRQHGARRRDDPLKIAIWQLAAGDPVDPDLLLRAAQLARHSHDYRQVVCLLNALPGDRSTAQTEVMLGESLYGTGDWEEADRRLASAGERAGGEQERLSVLVSRIVNLFWVAGQKERALQLIGSALEHDVSTAGQKLLTLLESNICSFSGSPLRALELFRRAESMKSSEAVEFFASLVLEPMKAGALALTGNSEAGIEWSRAAHEKHLKVDEKTLFPHPSAQLNSLILSLTEAGRLGEAVEVGGMAYSDLMNNTTKVAVSAVWSAIFTARAEYIAGHMESARDWYTEAAGLAHETHNVTALRMVLRGMAAVAVMLGDDQLYESSMDESSRYPVLGLFAGEEDTAPAWRQAGRGNSEAACAILEGAAEAARATGQVFSESLILTDLARIGRAQRVVPRLLEIAGTCDGQLAGRRAEFASALASGEPDRLLASSEALSDIGMDLLAAEAASVAAGILERSGDDRRAAAARRRTDVCADRCPGVRTHLLKPDGAAGGVLTKRELEVARMAGSGTSSKDIAAALHLSIRTVDNHIQRAYAKLGVSSRKEISAALENLQTS